MENKRMRMSVCVAALYMGKDFPQAMAELGAKGFHNVEFWGLWDKDIQKIAQAKKENQINITALCTRFFSLTDPSKRSEYVNGVKETLDICNELDCDTIISQVGNHLGTEGQHQSIVEGLKEAAPLLKRANKQLVIEPLNPKDHPPYYLRTAKEAFDIVDEVNSQSIKVLYDIYHQQITEGNLLETIIPNIHKIGHFHAAGVPGRHDLFSSEIDYRFILQKITEAGYQRALGLEYFPQTQPLDSLQLLQKHTKDIHDLIW